jgi:hypothetical protein
LKNALLKKIGSRFYNQAIDNWEDINSLKLQIRTANLKSTEKKMIEHTLDTHNSILYLRPTSPLAQDDFVQITKFVDPYIEKTGGLTGLVIQAPTFPGWESFGAVLSHFRFVRDHHKQVKKIALVTDSVVGNLAEHLAAHFVSAEIKQFRGNELEVAKQWILTMS